MFDLNDQELNHIQSQVGSSTLEVGLDDLLIDPVVEGFQAAPTYQAIEFITSGAMDEGTLPADSANKRFGLEGTPVAFEEGQMVSEKHAKHVRNKWMDTQVKAAKKQEIENRYGSVTTGIATFAGNLVGGAPDPINLGLGFGAAMAMRKAGYYTVNQALNASAVQLTKEQAKREIIRATQFAAIENLAVNTATEFTFGKLHEYATNQEISTKDRVFGIMAGSILGTGIQAGLAARSIKGMAAPEIDVPTKTLVKREHTKAVNINENYGVVGEQLVMDIFDHAAKSEANMVVFNPDYVKSRMDTELFETRSYQQQYEFTELDDFSLGGTAFYKAKLDQDTHVSDFGVGFSDNYNFVHNSVTREGMQVSKKHRIEGFDMSTAAVMDRANFLAHKDELFTGFRQKLAPLMNQELDGPKYNKFKKSLSSRASEYLDNFAEQNNIGGQKLSSLKADLVTALEGSENLTQFKEALETMAFQRKAYLFDADKMMDSIFFDARFEGLDFGTGVKSADDIFMNALEASEDFKDFLDFTRAMFDESDFDVNVDQLIRETMTDMGFDGVHMVMNKGEATAHNMVYMFNQAKAKRTSSSKPTPFNVDTEGHIVKKLKKLEFDEFNRWDDPKQSNFYDLPVVKEAEEAIAAVKGQDPEQVVMQGILDDLEASGEIEMPTMLFKEEPTAKVEEPGTAVEGQPKKVLDENEGIAESLKTNEDESTLSSLANCIFKSKGQ